MGSRDFLLIVMATWLAWVTAVVGSKPATQAVYQLAWDPSPDPTVTGSILYYGTNSGVYFASNTYPAAVTNVAISNLTLNARYYFSVTAVNQYGVESECSNELVVTNQVADVAPLSSEGVAGQGGGANEVGPTASAAPYPTGGAVNRGLPLTGGVPEESDGQASTRGLLRQREPKPLVADNLAPPRGAIHQGPARLPPNRPPAPTGGDGEQPWLVCHAYRTEVNWPTALTMLPTGEAPLVWDLRGGAAVDPSPIACISASFCLGLGTPSLCTDGVFEFGFPVQMGCAYVVEASVDLKTWSPVSTNIPLAGELRFRDLGVLENKRVFYRVVVP